MVFADRPTPLATTIGGRTFFRRDALESDLWAYGEDALVEVVRRGLPRSVVEAIGDRHAQLTTEADPGTASGYGYAFDRATAMAAVEVIEGAARPLARARRRSMR